MRILTYQLTYPLITDGIRFDMLIVSKEKSNQMKFVNKPDSLRDKTVSYVKFKQKSSCKIFINAHNPGKFVN